MERGELSTLWHSKPIRSPFRALTSPASAWNGGERQTLNGSMPFSDDLSGASIPAKMADFVANSAIDILVLRSTAVSLLLDTGAGAAAAGRYVPGQPWLFPFFFGAPRYGRPKCSNWNGVTLNSMGAAPPVLVRECKGGRSRVVPAHPELVDASRSVRKGKPGDKVFTGWDGAMLSPGTAARWITEGIAKACLQTVATGTGVKGPGSHSAARHWLQSGLNVNAVW